MIERMDRPGLAAVTEHRPGAALKRHGRSFYFASHFLPRLPRQRATRLYAFCRWADDLVDESQAENTATVANLLETIDDGLATHRTAIPQVADFIALARETGIPRAAPRHLVEGLRQDQGAVALADEDALRRYAYRVAGSVGVMMAAVLGLQDRRGFAHAIDLGIAMQFTNIARDVAEDARRGRRYLPACWFEPAAPPDLIADLARHEPALRHATRRLLALAEPYYASGERGLALLPPGVRPGIRIAAKVYRDIGTMIARQGYSPLAPRARTPARRKLAVALRGLPALWWDGRHAPLIHDRALHAGFHDLAAAVLADGA